MCLDDVSVSVRPYFSSMSMMIEAEGSIWPCSTSHSQPVVFPIFSEKILPLNFLLFLSFLIDSPIFISSSVNFSLDSFFVSKL